MADHVFQKEKIEELLKEMAKNYEVHAPLMNAGIVRFGKFEEGGPALAKLEEYSNSSVPPKELLFPQTETLFRYRMGAGEIEPKVPDPEAKVALFGIRPCDAQAFAIVDKLFGWDYPDPYFQNRRKSTVLVGLACSSPCSTCFCTSLGGGPANEEHLDLIMYDLGDEIYLKTITEKGEALCESISDLLGEASPSQLEACENQSKEAVSKISRSIDTKGVPEKLPALNDHPFWEQFSDRCLGCGICTYLCPTCHCFDIQDEIEGFDGRRARMWDTCMFEEYTRHASGHNPRPTRKERTRNRVSHKYSYFPTNFGVIACVGCGRCIKYCPVNIDIIDILKKSVAVEVKEAG